MNNKKIISLVLFASLFCFVNSALADGIQPPLGVPTSFSALLQKIAGQVGLLIASLGTIMVIVAGILYLTSAGSPERTGVAKKALMYAIVGLVIGLLAVGIVEAIKTAIGATASC